MEARREFLTALEAASKHRSGSIKGKTRTALFWSNLKSHPHWEKNIMGFLGDNINQAKIELIYIIRNNSSAIKYEPHPYNPKDQKRFKEELTPESFGTFVTKKLTSGSISKYTIFFSNMVVSIFVDEDIKSRLNMICNILAPKVTPNASGKKKRKTLRNRK